MYVIAFCMSIYYTKSQEDSPGVLVVVLVVVEEAGRGEDREGEGTEAIG